jgi:hypothetical protein
VEKIELGYVGFFGFYRIFAVLDIFFKKNEELISSIHLLTFLLKLGGRSPSVFFD